jgi:nitric oxide synthase oxygenase domain/subunit
MLREARTVAKAAELLEQVADELDWTPAKLSKRMLEVKLKIAATGTYQHTAEELQRGARLAWRNSVKVSIQ